jgi:iron complex outermembrane receptor protein
MSYARNPALKQAFPLIALAVTSALWGSHAFAQAAKPDVDSGALEEVVVTAEKREANLQTTPVAVTALSGDDLSRAGVREFTALEKVVPEVRVERVVGMPRVSIRGVFAQNLAPTSDSPNAVHVDGVYLPKASALGGMFFDVERVEVLKGPQGTLYGRNATGGAMNIIAKKPTKDFGAGGELEIGNYNLQRAEAAINLPMSDTLSTRLAVSSYRHDGYYKNRLEDAGEQSARLSTLWTPDDHQSLLLTWDQERINDKGPGVPNALSSPDPRTIIPSTFDNTAFYGNDPPFFYQSLQTGLMAKYDYTFDPATLTIQVGHREQRSNDFLAGGLTSLDVNGQFTGSAISHEGNFNESTLEARLTSTATRPLQWVAGVFAMRLSDSGAIRFFPGIPPGPHSLPLVEQGNPYEIASAYAAFAQGTWTPEGASNWHFTLGARYSEDVKHAITTTTGILVPTPDRQEGADKFKAPTWRAAVAYDVTPKSLVYGSVSRGYNSGGFAFAPPGANAEYKSEFVTSYELGSKNRFLDDHLQINAEIYYSKYNDLSTVYAFTLPQPAGPPALMIGIANGAATYKGGTIDVEWAPGKHDRVNFNITRLDAQYGSYDLSHYANQISDPTNRAIAAGQLFPLDGKKINSVAPWSGNASYTHTWEGDAHSIDATVGFQYRGKTQVDTDFPNTANEVLTYVDPVKRWDLQLRYAPIDQKWDVTAYAHNLFNEADYSTKSYSNISPPGSPPTSGVVSGVPMEPRTFGLIVGAHF